LEKKFYSKTTTWVYSSSLTGCVWVRAVAVAFAGSGSSELQSQVVPWSVQVVHWVKLY